MCVSETGVCVCVCVERLGNMGIQKHVFVCMCVCTDVVFVEEEKSVCVCV